MNKKDINAIKVAKKFVGQKWKIEDIAKDMKMTISQVNRYLKYAREKSIIETKINENIKLDKTYTRIERLEATLCTEFKLTSAIVVEMDYNKLGQPDKDGFTFNDTHSKIDDEMHEILGMALADDLIKRFRPDDKNIAVGGGRGPFYTIKGLQKKQAVIPKGKKIQVTSLSGAMSTRLWGQPTDTSDLQFTDLDPDNIAIYLSNLFRSTPKRTFLPIAVETNDIKNQLLNQGSGQLLSIKNWENEKKQYVPSIAIVGIGSLAGGHRIARPYEGLELEPIKKDLNKLLGYTKEVISETKHKYYPVGDICNRLFLAETSPRLKSDVSIKDNLGKIKGLIDSLNKRIIAVEEKQLRMIPFVVAIAGGIVKFNAIWTTLMKPLKEKKEPLIHILCTDSKTAKNLIEEYEAFQTQSEPI